MYRMFVLKNIRLPEIEATYPTLPSAQSLYNSFAYTTVHAQTLSSSYVVYVINITNYLASMLNSPSITDVH